MDGAKKAIIAVLSDSSLTSGANFGFGHWNAGEKAYSKNRNPGGGGSVIERSLPPSNVKCLFIKSSAFISFIYFGLLIFIRY